MKKKFLPIVTMLVPFFGIAIILVFCFSLCLPATTDAQPVFATPEQNPFNLNPVGYPGAIIKLVDIDHDDTLEAIVRFTINGNPHDVQYYENEGSNEAPAFVFEISTPFGIPVGAYIPFQFVDIDGDNDEDLFFGRIGHQPYQIHMIENTGNDTVPDFSDPFQLNPYGISLPVSDLDGSLFDGAIPTFADIDNDGDFDLFLGGAFDNGSPQLPDEALFFLENSDTSGNGTAPQFNTIVKNPFGFVLPPGTVYHWEMIADMDCDGDFDMYLASPDIGVFYFENIGTPEMPDFSEEGVPYFAPGPDGYFNPPAGSFLDIGGDGDLDLMGGSQFGGIQYFENLSSPEVDFGYVHNELTFNFTDESSDNVTAWLWDFGDGNTSDEQNPEHTYFEGGAYEVCLTVWGELNCNNTFCMTVDTTSVATEEHYLAATMTLYPNPASGFLTLELNPNEYLDKVNIEIFDWSGQNKTKLSRQISGKVLQESINLEDLPVGVYTLKVSSEGKFIVRKFIIVD